jgi:hypothetical protein
MLLKKRIVNIDESEPINSRPKGIVVNQIEDYIKSEKFLPMVRVFVGPSLNGMEMALLHSDKCTKDLVKRVYVVENPLKF